MSSSLPATYSLRSRIKIQHYDTSGDVLMDDPSDDDTFELDPGESESDAESDADSDNVGPFGRDPSYGPYRSNRRNTRMGKATMRKDKTRQSAGGKSGPTGRDGAFQQ